MAAYEPPKRPHLILLEILRASPSEGILDGFFNGIRKKQPFRNGVGMGGIASKGA
jgi:hypothetical protein